METLHSDSETSASIKKLLRAFESCGSNACFRLKMHWWLCKLVPVTSVFVIALRQIAPRRSMFCNAYRNLMWTLLAFLISVLWTHVLFKMKCTISRNNVFSYVMILQVQRKPWKTTQGFVFFERLFCEFTLHLQNWPSISAVLVDIDYWVR